MKGEFRDIGSARRANILNKKLQLYGFFRDEKWRVESRPDAKNLACAIAAEHGASSHRHYTREFTGSFTGAPTSDNFQKVTNRCRRGFAATLRNVLNVNQGFVMEKVIPAEECLLSVADTAKRLGVCRRTLEREVASGKFPPPVKARGKSLFFLSDVLRHFEQLKAARAESDRRFFTA